MRVKKITVTLLSVFILLLTVGFISASDVSVWQGQYYTGTAFNKGTYAFNFSVYDALSGGNLCYTNTTSLTTGNWGEWKIEQDGVNAACNNVSKDYYLNININGADQSPRKRLVIWDSLRKNVDETTSGNITVNDLTVGSSTYLVPSTTFTITQVPDVNGIYTDDGWTFRFKIYVNKNGIFSAPTEYSLTDTGTHIIDYDARVVIQPVAGASFYRLVLWDSQHEYYGDYYLDTTNLSFSYSGAYTGFSQDGTRGVSVGKEFIPTPIGITATKGVITGNELNLYGGRFSINKDWFIFNGGDVTDYPQVLFKLIGRDTKMNVPFRINAYTDVPADFVTYGWNSSLVAVSANPDGTADDTSNPQMNSYFGIANFTNNMGVIYIDNKANGSLTIGTQAVAPDDNYKSSNNVIIRKLNINGAYEMPNSTGTIGQVLMVSNTGKNVTWTNPTNFTNITALNLNVSGNIRVGGCIQYNCSQTSGCVTLGTCI